MNNRLINNVGEAKDGTYHIYELTHKLRDSAHRINDVERSVDNALETESLNDILTTPDNSVKPSTIRGLEDDFLTGASSEELADIESEVDRRPALQDEQIITLQEQINELTGQRDDLLRARMILTAVIKYSLTFCGFSV